MGRAFGSGQGVLASKRHHIWFLNIVREKLGANNMQDIENSQFGHLFEVQPLQFQGQLHVIMCKVLRSRSKERMCLEFEIGKSLVEFGPADFALVSGLNLGGSVETPDKSDFHSKMLKGSNKLSFKDIKKRFLAACDDDPDSHLALQLAYLYIVYGVVIMDRRLDANLPIRFIHLIDDLEKFKGFAWGRVSYEILVKRTHQTKQVIDSFKDESKDRKCEAPGFLDVLQVWAYEICKEMSNYCAVKVVPKIPHPARILRWQSDKRSSFDELYGFFLGSSGYEPVAIKATEEERAMLVRLGVLEEMRLANPVPVTRIPRGNKRKSENIEKGTVKRSSARLNRNSENLAEKDEKKLPTDSSETIQSMLKSAVSEVVRQVGIRFETFEVNISQRLQKLENRVQELHEKNTRKCRICCSMTKEKDESTAHPDGSPKSAYVDVNRNEADRDVDDEVHHKSIKEAQNDLSMEKDESTAHPDGSPHCCDGYDKIEEADVVAPAEVHEESIEDDESDLPKDVEASTAKLFDGSTAFVDGDDDMDEAYAAAHTEDHHKNMSYGENGAHDIFNDDFVLISKDIRPSISNPLCGVASPVNYETSLDEFVKLVSTSANEMVGVFPTQVFEIPSNDFDVSEVKWDPIKFQPFMNWMGSPSERTRSNVKRDCMHLPGDQLRWADQDNMSHLMRARSWLDNYHIDALLNIVAFEFDMDHRVRDWGVLDMAITNLLISKDFKIMSVEDHVKGGKPKHSGIPWDAIKRLFGCGNVGKDHWVLFEVSWKLQQVIVYDSMHSGHECISSYFEELARNIPKVLKVHRVWERQQRGISPRVPLREVWDVAVFEGSPQQPNTFDCGIFCMKVLECITRNIPFHGLNTKRGAIYRRSYCAKLWDWHTTHN